MAVAHCTLLAFWIVARILSTRAFVRSATDASEVFAFIMQAVAIAGFGVLLNLHHLAALAAPAP
jgi:hypothetical protein